MAETHANGPALGGVGGGVPAGASANASDPRDSEDQRVGLVAAMLGSYSGADHADGHSDLRTNTQTARHGTNGAARPRAEQDVRWSPPLGTRVAMAKAVQMPFSATESAVCCVRSIGGPRAATRPNGPIEADSIGKELNVEQKRRRAD